MTLKLSEILLVIPWMLTVVIVYMDWQRAF